MPPRLRATTAITYASGTIRSVYQATPFSRWFRAWCPYSWATTTSSWRSVNRPSSIESQMNTFREGPSPVVKAFGSFVSTSWTLIGTPWTPSSSAIRAAAAFSFWSRSGWVSGIRYGLT